jgi:hypothetical protein
MEPAELEKTGNSDEDGMNYQELRDRVLRLARELALKGPGWAQQSAVLRGIVSELGDPENERTEQLILTCWHDLFRDGELSWGFNIDNPNAPFFHVPVRQPERDKAGTTAGSRSRESQLTDR